MEFLSDLQAWTYLMSSNWASSWLAWKMGFFVKSSPRMHLGCTKQDEIHDYPTQKNTTHTQRIKYESKSVLFSFLSLPAAPHINSWCIPLFSQEQLRRPVPQCDHLIGVWSTRNESTSDGKFYPSVPKYIHQAANNHGHEPWIRQTA